MQSKIFSVNKTLNIGGRLIDLSQPRVMGILNVTPDSFYDGKKFNDELSILTQAEKMLSEGAEFIDVGGHSTRPGAKEVPLDEELSRVLPAINAIAKKFPEAMISIDTFRAQVARGAVEAGAAMINDISGGGLDSQMINTVAALQVPYVLTHMRGTPQDMAQKTEYENLIKDIIEFFQAQIFNLHALGVKDIIIDPGFGFAKTTEQNFALLNHLNQFQILGKPILAGLSRKSMIWKTLQTDPDRALNGTTALNTVALLKGASILRVHDVGEAREVINLIQRLH